MIINDAYAILSDPQARREYDAYLDRVERASQRAASPPPDEKPSPPKKRSQPSRPSSPIRDHDKPASQNAPAREESLGWVTPLLFVVSIVVFLFWAASRHERQPSIDQTTPPRLAPGVIASPIVGPQATDPPSPKIALPTKIEPTTPQVVATHARVISPELNLRSGPGTSFPVIARLKYAQAVTIINDPESDWATIKLETGDGYAHKAYLRAGSPETTLRELCPVNTGGIRNGQILSGAMTGEHSLSITAPTTHDVLVKLKRPDSTDLFLGFVEQGRTVTFNGIPNGTFRTWFATGKSFSAKCGRFVEDSIVSFDETLREYRVKQDGYAAYTTEMSYQLQRTQSGNFSPSHASVEDF